MVRCVTKYTMGIAGTSQTPAPGRPGRAVVPNRLASAHAHLPASYDPEALDRPIQAAIGVTEKHVSIATRLGKKVEEAMTRLEQEDFATTGDALELMDSMVTFHEKMSRSGAQLVKCIDELSRLRSFVSGGPDSRPDLSAKGEVELMQMIHKAADKLGFVLVPKADVVDVETS